VMFADVHGSLDMIDGRDAEQAQTMLDDLLRTMIDAVHRYEGMVNQILGDGIMAIFGAPLAHEDHAVRAASAALAIQDALRSSAGSAWERLGATPQVRIGLNSGVVIITAVNNDLSLDYRAVGATTHVASRMEQTAAPGTIRLTRDTFLLAEGFIDAESLGRLVVKGVHDPIEVYELRRMNPGGTRFRTRVARGLSPLFGRAEEMDLLEQLMSRALNGTACAVAFFGEPGVGKSRLCFEITRTELAARFRAIECGSSTHETAAPYSAIAALFRHYFGVAESDSREDLRARVHSGLAELGPALASERAIVFGLLDVAENAEWNDLDPGPRRNRVFAAARAFIRHIGSTRPTLLIFEDVHALDAASLGFIDDILNDPPARSLLVLLTSRTEIPSWKAKGVLRRHLLPLPPEQADAMLKQVLGDAPALAPLRRRLIDRTYGNPFFMEEMLRSLLEAGTLRGKAGHYELSTPNPTIHVPPTAAALIAARIDALAVEVKSLIQTAAVIGNEMAVDLLRRISGLNEDLLIERLNAAADSEVMYYTQLFPIALCGFRHALTHEVAYQSVLQSERRTLHARVVEVLEEVYADRIAEHVERLAEHSYLGELWEKSARYHIMAAARAASRLANQQSVQIIERGLAIAERLPSSRTRAEFEIDLRLTALAALLPLGEHQRMLKFLLEAEAIATSIDDQGRLGTIQGQIATALWILGHHSRSRESAERSLEIANRQKRYTMALAARFGLVLAHHALGDFDACIAVSNGLLTELQTAELELKRFGWAGYPAVLCRSFLASSLMFKGEFAAALPNLLRGCQIADELGHPYSRVIIHSQMGLYHQLQGDYELALDAMQTAWKVAHEGEVRTTFAPVAGWLGPVLTELGRPDEAIDVVLQVFDPEGRRVSHYGHVYTLDALAFAYARLGQWPKAFAYAQEAVDRTRVAGEHVHHGNALLRLATLQAERGPAYWNDAESIYREALDHAEPRKMLPLSAACYEGLAVLASRGGRQDEAREQLDRAIRLYRAMRLIHRIEGCEATLSRALA
jgi:class 3 adenylate cyclase/tetratricopeptide (TPR) repeat protein